MRERAKYVHPTAGDDNDKPNEEKRSTHDPRLNVKKNQDVNVHCNENKTLSMSGKRAFC